MLLYFNHCVVLVRSESFIFCISENDSERVKSSGYCSILLHGSREKSTFKEAFVYVNNLHHNEAEGTFPSETVTSEYL